MDFGAILSRAWQIIWKHKVLWIFGILAGCGSAATSGSENTGYRFAERDPGNFGPRIEQFINQMPDWQVAALVGGLILVGLVLVILIVLLGTIGRIGLIQGTVQSDRGAEKLVFGELFSYSSRYFWRVFALNLIAGIAAFLAFILFIAAYAVLAVATLGIMAICLLPLFCLLAPAAWFIQLWVEQANIALVVEDLGVGEAVRRGWEVIKGNFGAMLVMWLILGLIWLIVGGIFGIPLALIAGPAVIGVISNTEQALAGGVLISIICFIGYIPILLVLSGILRAYISSAWTLTYLRLTRPAAIVPTEPLPSPL